MAKLNEPNFDQFVRDSWLAGIPSNQYKLLPYTWEQRALKIYTWLELKLRFDERNKEIDRLFYKDKR